jgi:hypothetical protein
MDDTLDYVFKIEKLLDEIKKEKPSTPAQKDFYGEGKEGES